MTNASLIPPTAIAAIRIQIAKIDNLWKVIYDRNATRWHISQWRHDRNNSAPKIKLRKAVEFACFSLATTLSSSFFHKDCFHLCHGKLLIRKRNKFDDIFMASSHIFQRWQRNRIFGFIQRTLLSIQFVQVQWLKMEFFSVEKILRTLDLRHKS